MFANTSLAGPGAERFAILKLKGAYYYHNGSRSSALPAMLTCCLSGAMLQSLF
jgi:hypothetical protein